MTLHEPATFATDLLLAGWSAWLASRLKGSEPVSRWWRRAFLATAAAALSGGFYHGLGREMPPPVAAALWHFTLLAIVATSLSLWQASVYMCLSGPRARWLRGAAWLKAVGFVLWTLLDPRFLIVITDYGASMLLLTGLELRAWRARRAHHAKWILSAIATSVLAAVVQQMQLSPHPHFNHNDLYHVIQMAALSLFFLGAKQAAT